MNDLPLDAIVDALKRRHPDKLHALMVHPTAADILGSAHNMGGDPGHPGSFLRELGELAAADARDDLNEVLATLIKRSRQTAVLRFVSTVVASVSSAGIIAAIFKNADTLALLGSGIAFISSLTATSVTFLEEFSGGKATLQKAHENISAQARSLAEGLAAFRVGVACDRQDQVEEALRTINSVAANLQELRVTVGLPI